MEPCLLPTTVGAEAFQNNEESGVVGGDLKILKLFTDLSLQHSTENEMAVLIYYDK